MPIEDLGTWVPKWDSVIMFLTYLMSSHNKIKITQVSLDAVMGWKEGQDTSEINILWSLVTKKCIGIPLLHNK